MVEYVRFSGQEALFGQKSLLYTELEMLNALKHYTQYKKLRKQELALKVQVKTSLDDFKKMLKELDKLLPEANFKKYLPPKEKKNEIISLEEANSRTSSKKTKKKSSRKKSKKDEKEKPVSKTSLDSEIALIQKKLAALGG